jgi:hypothetical protein
MSDCPYKIFNWNCVACLIGKWDLVKYWMDTDRPEAFFLLEADIHNNMDLGVFNVPGYKVETCGTLQTQGKSTMICWYRNFLTEIWLLNTQKMRLLFSGIKNIIAGLYHPFKCFEGRRCAQTLTGSLLTYQKLV